MSVAPHDRGRVLSVLNLKGGVGKTHAVWLLACACIEERRRILLIDTDPQGNLSNSFLTDGVRSPGVERLLDPSGEPNLRSVIRTTAYPGVDIVPSSAAVSAFDLADQRAWEASQLERSFADAVEEVRGEYELIVFDCPPRLSLTSIAALTASDGVVVPLEAADWGAQGIKQVARAVEHVRARHNRRLRLLGYLISRYKGRRVFQRTYEAELRQLFGAAVFDTTIPDLAAFERAVTLRVPVTQREPRSRAAAIARVFLAEVIRRADEGREFGLSTNHGGGAGVAAPRRRAASPHGERIAPDARGVSH